MSDEQLPNVIRIMISAQLEMRMRAINWQLACLPVPECSAEKMSWRASFADLNILTQDYDTNRDILRFLGDC